MSDLISRQAAIDEIDEWIKAFRENGHKESAADACLIQDGIIKLSSAQPTYTDAEIQKMQDLESAEIEKAYQLGYEDGKKDAELESKWIPCTERLPKQGQEVICQCRASIIMVLKLDANGDWYQDAKHCYMRGFVIAWMPAPKSYRAERRTDETDT